MMAFQGKLEAVSSAFNVLLTRITVAIGHTRSKRSNNTVGGAGYCCANALRKLFGDN